MKTFNDNLPEGMNPFQLNQKANLTDKDFAPFRLTKGNQIKENDLLY